MDLLKNLILTGLVLAGATSQTMADQSMFKRLVLRNDQGKVEKYVDFIGELHCTKQGFNPIEVSLLHTLHMLDITEGPAISLYWELPDHDRSNSQLHGNFIEALVHFSDKRKNFLRDIGSFVMNAQHNRIAIQNIDPRTKKMYRANAWAWGCCQNAGSEVSFKHILQETEELLSALSSHYTSDMAQHWFNCIKSFQERGESALANAENESLEACAPQYEQLCDNPEQHDGYNRKFTQELLDSLHRPAVALTIYNAINQDSNQHIIVYTGDAHTTNVTNALLADGYMLEADYCIMPCTCNKETCNRTTQKPELFNVALLGNEPQATAQVAPAAA